MSLFAKLLNWGSLPDYSSSTSIDASVYPDVMWHQIFLRCDQSTLVSVQKTCRMFNSVLSVKFWIEKCERESVPLPPRSWRRFEYNASLDIDASTSHSESQTLRLFNYKKIYFKKPFFNNLSPPLKKETTIRELETEYSVHFHHGGNGIVVECPPQNCAEDSRIEACFATSFAWCYRYFEIDLVKDFGIDPIILDKIRPIITVREMNICRRDCSARYELQAQLLKEDEVFDKNALLPRFKSYSKNWDQWAGGLEWETAEHVFTDYPMGIRSVGVLTSGKDDMFWAGHYGPKFGNTEVIITFPEVVKLKGDDEFVDPPIKYIGEIITNMLSSNDSEDSGDQVIKIGPMFVEERVCAANEHPLEFTYVYSFFVRPPGKFDPEEYAQYVQPVAAVNAVEQFWSVYKHLQRPCDISEKVDIHFFKKGIKPVWEDDDNVKGGKWILRLKKGLSSRVWENLLLAMIGEQFLVGGEICGAVCSIRNQEDIVSLWNRTASDVGVTNRIRDTLRRVLNLPVNAVIEYKRHDDCLKDQSSYRHTNVDVIMPRRM